MTDKRLDSEQVERIIELRLDCVPVRQVAEIVGCNKATVVSHWHKWLDETTEERRADLERKRSEVIERMASVAVAARRGAVRARVSRDMTPDERAKIEARYLAEERQALTNLSRIAGFDAPTKVVTSFTPEMSDEEASKILAELDDLGI